MTAASTPHRVLVVDDEPNIVDVVTMALRFQGFAVEGAGRVRRRSPPSARSSPTSSCST
jgi:DNA-binding response OmpR family regulator